MRIAIMGTGAVGGYFGAFLSRAGHEVSFIARGAHLDAIRGHGLRLEGPRSDFVVKARATNAALTSLTRQPAGYVYHDPDLLPIARAALDEVLAVARAMGIALPADIAERSIAMMKKFPPGMYASMANDLPRGRRLELEGLSGYLVRKGRELGIPTPVHAIAYACLKPYLNGAQKEDPS